MDRNSDLEIKEDESYSRSLRGNVDRNTVSLTFSPYEYCRSLRGNVDRNELENVKRIKAVKSFPTWERG